MRREVNWAGNYSYTAAIIHRPRSVEEVQEIVSRTPRIRALGTRHSFNDIADSAELISLADIDPALELDREAMTATVGAGISYGLFGQALQDQGLALHNTGSLPHISVGGATATATHGSGDRNQNLATAVRGIELVTSDGELAHVARGDADFAGMVVHLGALGIVTRLTFDVQPTYQVCQEVCEHLTWDDLMQDFDAIFSSAYSVSVFTTYREWAGTLWLKHRLEDGQKPEPANTWHATSAMADRHPMDGWSGEACTPQMLVAGPWNMRLPHFRLDRIPASGEEIQSEYFVNRARALDVIAALRSFEPEMRDALMISEIRTIAADDLWLSTCQGRDSVAFHFSWNPDQHRVDALLPKLEEVLAPFDARPHWGKAFAATARDLEPRYEKLPAFRELVQRLDPRVTFRNEYLERRVLG